MNMLAFCGLILIAVALFISQLLAWIGVNGAGGVITAIRMVGECIAYIVTMVYAFYFVKNKRNVWWWVTYVAAVVIVVLLLILSITL